LLVSLARRDTTPMFRQELDFDDEAKKLFSSLNLDPNGTRPGVYNSLDPIWRDPSTGGTIYVGNQSAAQNKAILDGMRITHVVNCTDNMPFYHERSAAAPKISYYRFPASFWSQYVNNLPGFWGPMLAFVDGALARGESVLVHCLAGAHRAGTTGCLLLMYKAGLGKVEAIKSAKKLRPVIDPIGGLPELLKHFEAHRAKEAKQAAASQGFGAAVGRLSGAAARVPR